jgi:hypothetical protein
MSDFPVHVKFGDWTVEGEEFENEDVQTYFEDLLTETLFTAAGIGVVATFLLFFCCCTCHCGPSCVSSPQKRSSKCPSAQKSKQIAIATLILVVCMTLCGVGLFVFGLIGWYNGTDDAVNHTREAAVEAGDFFCTANIGDYDRDLDGAQCAEFSLDGFISNINQRTVAAFSSVLGVVNAISQILIPVDNILIELSSSSTSLTNMESALNGYQVSSTEVIDLLNELNSKDPNSPPIISNIPDASIVPEIENAQIQFVTDALSEVDSSTASVTDLRVKVANEIDNLNNEVIPEVNDIESEILDITEDIQDVIYNTMERLEEADGYLIDVQDLLDSNKLYFWIWVGTMAPLSLVIPLLALYGVVYAKPGAAMCSCGCQYIGGVTLWLPIIVGILLLVQTFVGDTCDVLLVGNEKSDFRGLFEVNLDDRTNTVGDTVVVLGNVVNPLLQCNTGCDVLEASYTPDPLPADWATNPFNPDNWPDEMDNVGLSKPECFDEEPAGAVDSNGYYRLTAGSYNTLNNFAGILGIEGEFNFTTRVDDFLDDITEAKAELDQSQLIQDSRDFITSAEVTSALQEDYTNGGQAYTDIDDAVTQINDIYLTFPGEAYDPVDDQKWNDVWGIADWSALTSAQQQDALDANIDTRNRLSDATSSLSAMRTTVEDVTIAQDSLTLALDGITVQLNNLEADLDTAIVQLDVTSSLTNAVVLYTYIAAPGHLECSWLANTYSNVVEEDICVSYHDGITTFAIGLGLLSAAGALLIIIMLDCGNPKRTSLLEDQDDAQELELGTAVPQSRYPNLAFGQSMPSPIARPVSNDYSQTKSDIPQAYAVPYRSGSITDTV